MKTTVNTVKQEVKSLNMEQHNKKFYKIKNSYKLKMKKNPKNGRIK